MSRSLNGNMSFKPMRGFQSVVMVALGLLATPAAQAFKSDLEGQHMNSTEWVNGPLLGWNELDLIPLRTLHTGEPVTNEVILVRFDHTGGDTTKPGIEDLSGWTASSNILITAGPTLSAPAGADPDIWSYTYTITKTDDQPGAVEFKGRLSAGGHLFPGASLNLSLIGPGELHISKPSAVAGSPDLALTKAGPTQAKTNQIITYVLSYTNKVTSPDTARGVQVTDVLPPQLAYVPNSGGKFCRLVGNTLIWDLGNLPPGKSGSGLLSYKAVVTNNIPETTTFTNYAQILSSQDDGTPEDNLSRVITTVAVNPLPIAVDDAYAIPRNETITIPAPGVLANDSNALFAVLSAILFAGPNYGSLTFDTNGSFIYLPASNFLGDDFFAYHAINPGGTSGPAVVTVTVTNTCDFTVSPDLITNAQPGECGTIVDYPPPVITGSCLPVVCTPPSGEFFPVGITTVTCANEDGISRSFHITVLDLEPPTIICPADMTVSTDTNSCFASGVALPSLTAGDNCGMVEVTSDAPLHFAAGTNLVTWTATDSSGNTNSCQRRIIVLDTHPPAITCPPGVTVDADPGLCTASGVVLGTPTTADNCAVA
ncbi:MAG: HYR domain-containing protein, partial [Verrucomicrobia bacterium]|nr:HYR domain-containing protein [Verrucomicrobiota bacterium]